MAQPEHDPASQALALSDPYMVQPEHGLSESEKPSKDAKWSKSAEISAVLVRKALEKASGRSRSPAAPEVIPTKSMPMWMKMQLKAAAPAKLPEPPPPPKHAALLEPPRPPKKLPAPAEPQNHAAKANLPALAPAQPPMHATKAETFPPQPPKHATLPLGLGLVGFLSCRLRP